MDTKLITTLLQYYGLPDKQADELHKVLTDEMDDASSVFIEVEQEELLLYLHGFQSRPIKLECTSKGVAYDFKMSSLCAQRLLKGAELEYLSRHPGKQSIDYSVLQEHVRLLRKMRQDNARFTTNGAKGVKAMHLLNTLESVEEFKGMNKTKKFSLIFDLMTNLEKGLGFSGDIGKEKKGPVVSWLKAYNDSLQED